MKFQSRVLEPEAEKKLPIEVPIKDIGTGSREKTPDSSSNQGIVAGSREKESWFCNNQDV
ncbi:hypothetical protein [Neobacillus fumarioli]|uniref:hypothetical protein n=1 Tax=Neobacillus fumarioli TaxID=105229 RepID=UPI000B26CB83|nr:hypothetical protein [Neobacillus fumarioli]